MLPSMDRLLYLDFGPSINVQTILSIANVSLPLPFPNVTAVQDFAPAIDTMHFLRSLVLSLLGYLAFGLGQNTGASTSIYNTRFPNVTWDNDLWQVRTELLDQGHYQSRMSVCNGYLGINVAALGPFFEADTPVAGDNINGWVRHPQWEEESRLIQEAPFR